METKSLLILITVLLVVVWLISRAKRLGYFDKKENTSTPSDTTNEGGFVFPCVLEGNIDMPPMVDIVKAARIDVEAAKEYLTSRMKYRSDLSDEECMALCSMPVKGQPGWDGTNEFGGGGAYGGRYMTGSYHFEIDAIGQQIPGKSWVKIFSDVPYPVTGGIRGDGVIAMGSIGGTEINGAVVNGQPSGRILHGDGKHYIYGVMNGRYTKI